MNMKLLQARGAQRVAGCLVLGLSFTLLGCAPLRVERTAMAPVTAPASAITLKEPLSGMLSNQDGFSLPAGSRWLQVGTVPQGDTYRRDGALFIVNGRRQREAYLVVNGGDLKGLYFPGESLYTAVPNSTRLVLEPK
ncbi:hypothetical protein [Bordetella sp. LUAb4]|uniref:hypothetical protein n=1 Tax=Bordetella sp. LUAb4 TaxID=2843195 RepID=UPI001E3F5522|nr:hypothetical protein [Bordetella sp. LUAb4]